MLQHYRHPVVKRNVTFFLIHVAHFKLCLMFNVFYTILQPKHFWIWNTKLIFSRTYYSLEKLLGILWGVSRKMNFFCIIRLNRKIVIWSRSMSCRVSWHDRAKRDEQLLSYEYQSKLYCINDRGFISNVQLK